MNDQTVFHKLREAFLRHQAKIDKYHAECLAELTEAIQCPTCEGTGIGACGETAEHIEIAGGCPRCHGTGVKDDV